MLISCEADNGERSQPVDSVWTYDPENPWVVTVDFIGYEAVWDWSLDLLRTTLGGSPGADHGFGDVVMEYFGYVLRVYLDTPEGSATLRFEANKVREFLSQIDDSNAEMIIGQKLDEFLETL